MAARNTDTNTLKDTLDRREQHILSAFKRLEQRFPYLQQCFTEEDMYTVLHERLQYVESTVDMQRKHCELKPVFPDVQKEIRGAVQEYIAHVDEKQREAGELASKRMRMMEESDKARVDMLKGQVDAMNSTRLALQPLLTDLHHLSSQGHTAAQNSSVKGAIGEKQVFDELVKQFPHMEVVPTGHIEHSCDIHVNPTPGDELTPKTIVEVKCYQHPVPTKEVDKFERDVRQSASPTALMIATSSISKKPRIHFSWMESTLVLFLSHSTAHHAPLGVLALQEIHRVCTAFRQSQASKSNDTVVSKDVMEKQLRLTCEEIDEVLGNNTHYAECVRDLEKIQMAAKGITKRLEEQRRHHSELVKMICQRFECDIGICCALTPGCDGATPVCTPHERRQLVEGVLQTKKQSVATMKRHSIGLAALHEVLDLHAVPLMQTQSSVSLLNPTSPHHTIGWLDVKTTKTTLSNTSGCVSVQLISEATEEHMKTMIKTMLSLH